MQENNVTTFVKNVLNTMPKDWLSLTTHRLDIYDESRAKTEFLEHFETLFNANQHSESALSDLPTAYDYIRLGHPLSCVLEWVVAKSQNMDPANVICFSSMTIPVFAILRENALSGKETRIFHKGELPESFDSEVLKRVYGYQFEIQQVENLSEITPFGGSTIFMAQPDSICSFDVPQTVDFMINTSAQLGSIILINTPENDSYISKVQHVRRRETIAMTPADCLTALRQFVADESPQNRTTSREENKSKVLDEIHSITGTTTRALVASSGLSMQYAIAMGLIDDALEHYPGKAIKFVVPPNCYGGTNDQARRVAAGLNNVEVVDLPVDSGNDMVQSVETILERIAKQDAVPYIIAEIPTNPRVEVPDLINLKEALRKERQTASGEKAVEPVFILDQTFCPNTAFLGEEDVLASVKALSYVSGSKFPSGGKCTAGYCVANTNAAALMNKIALHLELCDNEANDLQYEILATQLPTMVERIANAYKNTREFVTFIQDALPNAKINFVSEELASQGFTPSVFSLDLPTKGSTDEEREVYKRKMNLKLINAMIGEIPTESKYCVSYGQLKGCYWTIPATSTQGTTKEGDKDYIARVAVSPDLDLEKHKNVFAKFITGL